MGLQRPVLPEQLPQPAEEAREDGRGRGFFGQTWCSGSHLNSMEMVAGGEVDAATIDPNVLRVRHRSAPELRERLRVIETWGPFPIQPVVLRPGLHPDLKNRLRAALRSIGGSGHAPPALAEFGLERFAPVTYEHYASEEDALRRCERALGIWP